MKGTILPVSLTAGEERKIYSRFSQRKLIVLVEFWVSSSDRGDAISSKNSIWLKLSFLDFSSNQRATRKEGCIQVFIHTGRWRNSNHQEEITKIRQHTIISINYFHLMNLSSHINITIFWMRVEELPKSQPCLTPQWVPASKRYSSGIVFLRRGTLGWKKRNMLFLLTKPPKFFWKAGGNSNENTGHHLEKLKKILLYENGDIHNNSCWQKEQLNMFLCLCRTMPKLPIAQSTIWSLSGSSSSQRF